MRRLFEEDIVLVVEGKAPRQRRVSREGVPLILFPRHTGFRRYLEQRCSARGLTLNVKMETDNVEAIKSFVAIGLGASFLPITAVEHELARGTLVRARARARAAAASDGARSARRSSPDLCHVSLSG